MAAAPRQAVVDRLRDEIDKIQQRRPDAQAGAMANAGGGHDQDNSVFSRLDPYAIHEIWTPSYGQSGLATGFALGQGAGLISPHRPALIWLALTHESQETGLVYAPGFSRFGLASDHLVLVRAKTIRHILWAAEEAASSPVVAGVIMEAFSAQKTIDFTALRRLALRSGQSGTPVFVLRYGAGREASPALTRWQVTGEKSAPDPFDPRAPGLPLWRLVLEKAPGGQKGDWVVFWNTKEGRFTQYKGETHGSLSARTAPSGRPTGPAPAPLSGPPFPALGNPVSKTG